MNMVVRGAWHLLGWGREAARRRGSRRGGRSSLLWARRAEFKRADAASCTHPAAVAGSACRPAPAAPPSAVIAVGADAQRHPQEMPVQPHAGHVGQQPAAAGGRRCGPGRLPPASACGRRPSRRSRAPCRGRNRRRPGRPRTARGDGGHPCIVGEECREARWRRPPPRRPVRPRPVPAARRSGRAPRRFVAGADRAADQRGQRRTHAEGKRDHQEFQCAPRCRRPPPRRCRGGAAGR